jgi:hypothetical protein
VVGIRVRSYLAMTPSETSSGSSATYRAMAMMTGTSVVGMIASFVRSQGDNSA